MKDFHMFKKLFFVLCSSLIIALTSPSVAEDYKWPIISVTDDSTRSNLLLQLKEKETRKRGIEMIKNNFGIESIIPAELAAVNKNIEILKALTSTSVAEEPAYHTIQGKTKKNEVFGTKLEALRDAETLRENSPRSNLLKRLKEMEEDKQTIMEVIRHHGRRYADTDLLEKLKNDIPKLKEEIKIVETRIIAPMVNVSKEREINYKAKKIADAKAKKTARLAAEAEAKRKALAAEAEAKRKAEEAARLVAEAKAKKIEDARLAKIAAAELKKQQAYAYKVKMEGESLEKRLKDPVFAKKYKEDQIKLGWMLERVQRKEEAARIKEVIRKQRLEDMISIVLKVSGRNGTNNPNIIKSITKDGIVRTTYCNPGPCTPGSVKMHGILSGMEMGIDVGTLAKRIKANAAQTKSQDNTNENNAKTAEETASLGVVSIDTLFVEAEADLDETNDLKWTRARSIPIEQVIRAREAHTDYIRNSHENEMYCKHEGS